VPVLFGEDVGKSFDRLAGRARRHDLELCHCFPHAPLTVEDPCHGPQQPIANREHRLQKLRDLIRGNECIVAPVACNPIMARMAEDAGFKAIYLSGGTLGWVKCITEANISVSEMAEIAVDIRAACKLPLVLDAGGGWGDPVHIHRTMTLTEAAGFQAIEIE